MPTVAELSSGKAMAASAHRLHRCGKFSALPASPVRSALDIQKIQWTKLLWNAPFCAISCLAHANVKQIVESESLTALALDCMTEVQTAARTRNIDLRREQFDEIMTFSRTLGAVQTLHAAGSGGRQTA